MTSVQVVGFLMQRLIYGPFEFRTSLGTSILHLMQYFYILDFFYRFRATIVQNIRTIYPRVYSQPLRALGGKKSNRTLLSLIHKFSFLRSRCIDGLIVRFKIKLIFL